MSALTKLERNIARRCASGPVYFASFRAAQPIVKHMVKRGLLMQLAADGSAWPNMVALTDKGRTRLLGPRAPAGQDNYAVARARRQLEAAKLIEKFAELLAEGWTIKAAAEQLGRSAQTGTIWFRQIKQGLGEQAR